jgi:hypothetical protein
VSRSSCELEIHATDECCELTQGLRLVMDDLGLPDVQSPTEIFNGNRGCVDWTKGWANRKMRHMNVREMAVRESQIEGEVQVNHISLVDSKLGSENRFAQISARISAIQRQEICFNTRVIASSTTWWRNNNNPTTQPTADNPTTQPTQPTTDNNFGIQSSPNDKTDRNMFSHCRSSKKPITRKKHVEFHV